MDPGAQRSPEEADGYAEESSPHRPDYYAAESSEEHEVHRHAPPQKLILFLWRPELEGGDEQPDDETEDQHGC